MFCFKTFIWKRADVRRLNHQHWFKLWVLEGFSIRQLVELSGLSRSTLLRIKNVWLAKTPDEIQDLSAFKYLLLDGTYFHKDGCLLSLILAHPPLILSNLYVPKEGYEVVLPWFARLKKQGLDPIALTSDGERSILRALKELWPHAVFQRCLYHIQHEGCRWLRSQPQTQAGRDLRKLLLQLAATSSVRQKNQWIQNFHRWQKNYQTFLAQLPNTTKANVDLKRTVNLIHNALPNMFHYLMNPSIPSTTNKIENWHSLLKRSYRQHAGLTQPHKIQYLRWFSYFKNQQKTNNF